MPVNPHAVGEKGTPVKRSWKSKDALLYAIGVGAGVDELAFTTENTKDTEVGYFNFQIDIVVPVLFVFSVVNKKTIRNGVANERFSEVSVKSTRTRICDEHRLAVNKVLR